ncbi:MAG: glycine cleavage system protein GcvH [Planctomycetes bacterium]|nr:glycine cleavage system protein GcvH [Planctomycetota bacterium]
MSPSDLRYAKTHEWVRVEGGECVVGLTRFAVDQLTDVTYIQLPKAGRKVAAGEGFGEIESVKAVSDIYAPVSGEVASVNEALNSDPGLVSRDPYGAGWLARIRVPGGPDLSGLMSAAEYEAQVSGSPH